MLRTQAFFCSRSLYNCLSVCTIKRLQIFKMVLLARHFISQQFKKKKKVQMFSKLFRAARLSAAAPNISECSSKRTRAAFLNPPNYHIELYGEKRSSPHLCTFLTLTQFVPSETVRSSNAKPRHSGLMSQPSNNHETGF